MKFILLLFITFPVFACMNKVPQSEAQRFIDAAPNGVQSLYTCEDKPEEPCLCFDNIDWNLAEIVTETVSEDDFSKPKYGPEKDVEACEGVRCAEILVDKKCEPNHASYISKDFDRVYCIEFKGYEKIVKNVTKIVNNEAKRAAEAEAREVKKTKKERARKALKEVDLSKATTVASLKSILKEIIDLLDE